MEETLRERAFKKTYASPVMSHAMHRLKELESGGKEDISRPIPGLPVEMAPYLEGAELLKPDERVLALLDRLSGRAVDSRALGRDVMVVRAGDRVVGMFQQVGSLELNFGRARYGGRVCYHVKVDTNVALKVDKGEGETKMDMHATAYISPGLTTLYQEQVQQLHLSTGMVRTRHSRVVFDMTDRRYSGDVITEDGVHRWSLPPEGKTGGGAGSFIFESADKLLQRLLTVEGWEGPLTFSVVTRGEQLAHLVYTKRPRTTIEVDDSEFTVTGIERRRVIPANLILATESDGEEDAEDIAKKKAGSLWLSWLTADGRCVRRSELGTPFSMDIDTNVVGKAGDMVDVFKDAVLGESQERHSDGFDFRSLEVESAYNDRVDVLKREHGAYVAGNPQLRRLLGDFMRRVILHKPGDVFTFAAEHFQAYR